MTALTASARQPAEQDDQAMLVRAGGVVVALPTTRVETVFRTGAITPVPLAPAVIAGLVNLRGRVVTAIDLARRFAGATAQPETITRSLAIAINCGSDPVALLVDDVGEVVVASDLVAAPPHVPVHFAHLTQAWLRTKHSLVPLIDVDRLLDISTDRRSGVDRRSNPFSRAGD